MTDKISLTIDGRTIEAKRGMYLLEALQSAGIEIPTLCSHKSLAPAGECRLCMVEVGKPGDWTKMVASCLFPVKDGMYVSTHSERVVANRQALLKLYLANSPDSEVIKNIARYYGVDQTPFSSPDNADDCINCGMCLRTCQNLSTSAIAGLNRSTEKKVGPGNETADDCTGCLACAYVCPTDFIKTTRKDETLTIWNKQFNIPLCQVDKNKCTACGLCEEACPFSIPCVSLFKDGTAAAEISKTDCVGCGICVGACPNNAINQEPLPKINNMALDINALNIKNKKIVFACSRSKTDKEDVFLVPCIGKVSPELLFQCLARGAHSVALMCRDQATCPYGDGGAQAEKRLEVIHDIFEHIGLPKNTVQFISPGYGKEGPDTAIEELNKSTLTNPFKRNSDNFKAAGLEKILEILTWSRTQYDAKPLLNKKYKHLFDENAKDVLFLGHTLVYDSLLSLTGDTQTVKRLVEDALTFLNNKGIAVKPAFTPEQIAGAETIYVLSPEDLPEPASNQKVIDVNAMAGGQPGPDNNDPVFNVDMTMRRRIIDAAKKDMTYRCNSLKEAVRTAYVLRKGSWEEVLDVQIIMAFSKIADAKKECQESDYRITSHPIMPSLERPQVDFTFNGRNLKARQGEVISSALYAAGISVFGHHHKDEGAQGIYCVNGQCSQCTVVANGKPVKSCMIPVQPGMKVESVEGLPELADASLTDISPEVEDVHVPVLVIGGGPAGIAAATELGQLGVEVLIVDDKQELGGKLSLQTHNFFGSVADCWASTRGMDIGYIMTDTLKKLPNVKVWLNSTVVGVYVDKKLGVVTNGQFRLVSAEKTLVAAGAREKGLAFPGSDLPGVYGAGAFQTLVNRDLVRCAEKLFVIGGGNVGLIGAYHALQVGIDVVGLVEAMPECGGYKVHKDKIKRLGVPVWTSHTVLKAEGKESGESVTIVQIDEKFQPIKGTERTFEVDTVLVAVGLSPVNEFLVKAQMYGMDVYSAGDAKEIAEASAAIFSGKITGRQIARDMDINVAIPSNWKSFGDILKHHSSTTAQFNPEDEKAKVFPVIRCVQEIPCDPCVGSCPKNLISMKDNILSLPEYEGLCLGCASCVRACPGLAITLVFNDYDPEGEKALVMLPFEFVNEAVPLGKEVVTTDLEGEVVATGKAIAVRDRPSQDRRKLLLVEVPDKEKLKVAGFRIRDVYQGSKPDHVDEAQTDPIICRCERVRKSDIVREIRNGVKDINQMKALVRIGMGGCGGKTCTDLILRIYKEEGVPLEEVTMPTARPLVAEVHLGDFVKNKSDKEEKKT